MPIAATHMDDESALDARGFQDLACQISLSVATGVVRGRDPLPTDQQSQQNGGREDVALTNDSHYARTPD
jgi:hypothetical protein